VASGRKGGKVRLCIVTTEPRQEIARNAIAAAVGEGEAEEIQMVGRGSF
jgi:hypothetical protein